MPEPISKMELDQIQKRGGKVETLPKLIEIPGLERIVKHFHDMKHEQTMAYKAAAEAKLAKLDELIKALEKNDLADAMKRLCEIQNAMLEMKQKHMAEEKDDDDDPDDCREPSAMEQGAQDVDPVVPRSEQVRP